MRNIKTDPLTIRIEGTGGMGGSSIGEVLARSAARAGYFIQCHRAFPAEIKGGRAWFQLKISGQPLGWWGGAPALDMTDVKGGDWTICYVPSEDAEEQADVSPLQIAKSAGNSRDANLVALGFLAATIGIELEIVSGAATQRYHRRGGEIAELDAMLAAGYNASRTLEDWVRWDVPAPKMAGRRMVINGNEAVALGALAAGVRFFAGYPITPASSILEFMLHELPKMGGTALQMEDEIAGLAACLGASFTGTRAMCATSGPGFALMSELMNLAVVSEMPVTIVDVQRSGPATGQPSKSEQADLLYAVHGSPGDSPRIVLAPSTVEEAFHMTVQAVNLAERYQMPVILLSDGSLSGCIEAIPEPDWEALPHAERQHPPEMDPAEFNRFLLTPTGVSEVSLPGDDDLPYIAGGMEHSIHGDPSATSEAHYQMSRKRLQKVATAAAELSAEPGLDSLTPQTRIGVLGWGSTRGAIEEACRQLKEEGISVAAAQLRILNPLPEESLRNWMGHLDRVIVAEENQTGQLAQLIRHLAPAKISSLLSGAEPWLTPETVMEAVMESLRVTVQQAPRNVAEASVKV